MVNPLIKAALPQVGKIVMGEIDRLTPADFEGTLRFARELIDSRLAGDVAYSAELLNGLDVSPEFRNFLAAVLWSHYAQNQNQRAGAVRGENGERENLPGPPAGSQD